MMRIRHDRYRCREPKAPALRAGVHPVVLVYGGWMKMLDQNPRHAVPGLWE